MQDGLVKTIFKTFGITVAVVVSGFVYVVVCLSVLFPKCMTGFYGDLGLKSARAYMFERVYRQTGNDEDLYNVIEVKIQNNDHEDMVRYIKKMQSKSNYNDFCAAVDERNTRSVSPRLYVYVCDYDAYLKEQYVIALYGIGNKDKAQTIALQELAANTNEYAWEFGAFIDCIVSNNKLTDLEKKTALSKIYDMTVGESRTVQSCIDSQLDQLDEGGVAVGLEKLKITYQKIVIKTTNKLLAQAKDDTVLVNAVIEDISNLNQEYNATLAELL